MKKIILFAFTCILLSSCGSMEERLMKRDIKDNLKETLHNPSSLEDLNIRYAYLDVDKVQRLYERELVRGNNPKYTCGGYIVIAEYRAKNGYGAYRNSHSVYIYKKQYNVWLRYFFDTKKTRKLLASVNAKPIAENQLYLIDDWLDWKSIK